MSTISPHGIRQYILEAMNPATHATSLPPLAWRLLDDDASISNQTRCPLFTKLPPEVREIVWRYALQQYEDQSKPYDLNHRWARPGRFAAHRIITGLLQTCKAVYVEAFLFPVACNTVYVFDGDPSDRPPSTILHTPVYNIHSSLKMKTWQFATITSVDLTVQQDKLEGGALDRCARNLAIKERHEGCHFDGRARGEYPSTHKVDAENGQGTPIRSLRMPLRGQPLSLGRLHMGSRITHLTLRLGRTDWWTWTDDPSSSDTFKHLRLEPMINHTRASTQGYAAMLAGQAARRDRKDPDFGLDKFEAEGRWGLSFAEFWPDLESLKLVMETFEAKETQLDKVVECARLWKFPLRNGHQLAFAGEEAVHRWQGVPAYGYERGTPWLMLAPSNIQEVTQRAARFVRRQFRRGTPGEEQGQKFVAKSLEYRRM